LYTWIWIRNLGRQPEETYKEKRRKGEQGENEWGKKEKEKNILSPGEMRSTKEKGEN